MPTENTVPFGVSPGREAWIRTPNGLVMAFESSVENKEGTSYIRFLNEQGGEVAYWESDEWANEPVEVMGAICGAMLAKTMPRREPEYYQFAEDCEFPEGVEFTPYGE